MAKIKVTKKKQPQNEKTKTNKTRLDSKSVKLKPKDQKQRSRNVIQRKSVQTPINKFAVPVSELNRLKFDTSKNTDTAVKKRKFSGKQTKNWKLLNQSTKDYICECLETGVGFIISKATNEGHKIDSIQDKLTHIVQLIQKELQTLKAPSKSYGDLKKFAQIQRSAVEQLKYISNHEETLEQIVREEENGVRHHQRELQRLQTLCDNEIELHPFLQNFKPELNIPPI